MAATITAKLDKAFYAPGEMMTLKVSYTVPPESRVTVHSVLAYLGGTLTSPAVDAVIKRLEAVDPQRTWTFVSDTGTEATYRAVA